MTTKTPRTAATYLAAAADKLAAGFTSKAGQKAALDDVSRALDCLKGAATGRMLAEANAKFPNPEQSEAVWAERSDWINAQGYWDLPAYPHLIRPHHPALFGDNAHQVLDCFEMRQLILAAEIVKIERDTTETEKAAVIRESIMELMARRRVQYDRALYLGEMFGGLRVSANVHVCVNEHGTRYLRAFYYLNGHFTPLNVIMAAAEELERREAA